jgi:hypothetical protein
MYSGIVIEKAQSRAEIGRGSNQFGGQDCRDSSTSHCGNERKRWSHAPEREVRL